MQVEYFKINKPNADLYIVKNKSDFVTIACDKIVKNIQNVKKEHALVALSGGSTPYPIYEQLPNVFEKEGIVDKCYWIQVDERLDKMNVERSNQKKIMESMFYESSPLGCDHFININISHSKESICNEYLSELLKLPTDICSPAPIDLTILGLGSDGHTASLFPELIWNSGAGIGYEIFEPQTQPEPRMSLSFDRIVSSSEILFLVDSKGKTTALEEIFNAETCLKPASCVAKSTHTTWVIVDDGNYSWLNKKNIEPQKSLT